MEAALEKTQIRSTKKMDFENAPSLPNVLSCVSMETWLYTVVCQMQAAQLLMVLCSPNAQHASSLLCGFIYKINIIYLQERALTMSR